MDPPAIGSTAVGFQQNCANEKICTFKNINYFILLKEL